MKKVLLSLAVVAALGMTSCGGKSSEDQVKEVCDCIQGIWDIASEGQNTDESELEELKDRIKAKGEECNVLEKKIYKGKSDKQVKKITKEIEDCGSDISKKAKEDAEN